jgi:hypothetical protein
MQKVTCALVLLCSGLAAGQGTKGKSAAAVAAATAAIDKADAAFNAHEATLGAMLDKSFFGAGPTVSAKLDSPEAMTEHLKAMLAKGGHMSREGLTVKADDDGGAAWYVADYVFIPKVPPGALPVHRKLRESGVLVKRGKEWKFAMLHLSVVQPDPPGAPPATAPAKK